MFVAVLCICVAFYVDESTASPIQVGCHYEENLPEKALKFDDEVKAKGAVTLVGHFGLGSNDLNSVTSYTTLPKTSTPSIPDAINPSITLTSESPDLGFSPFISLTYLPSVVTPYAAKQPSPEYFPNLFEAIPTSSRTLSPDRPMSSGISSPAIPTPSGLLSPVIPMSSGILSPAIPISSGILSPAVPMSSGIPSPIINVPENIRVSTKDSQIPFAGYVTASGTASIKADFGCGEDKSRKYLHNRHRYGMPDAASSQINIENLNSHNVNEDTYSRPYNYQDTAYFNWYNGEISRPFYNIDGDEEQLAPYSYYYDVPYYYDTYSSYLASLIQTLLSLDA